MFKKKEKTEKAPKNKKVRTMKVGTHKKSVLLLWAVLLDLLRDVNTIFDFFA